MPLVVPVAMAAGEYAISSGAAASLAGTALAAAGQGTAAYGAFAAADAATGMTGLQLAGLAASTVQGIGSNLQAKGVADSARYNAEISANNQIIAQNNATETMREGEANASAASQATKAKIGGILANQGASGVDINSGSSLDVRSSAAQNGELNAINIRADAARKAYGYNVEATNQGIQEKIDKSTASNAELTGDVKSAGNLLSSVGNPNNPFGAYLASQSIGL